jgi:cell division septum initiation protein DivIVA
VTGEEVGVIEGVYLDNVTRSPEWAAVRLGPDALALIPLADASGSRSGVQVEFDLDMILDAPFQLSGLDNEVTEETEQLLYRYYEGGGASAPPAVEHATEVLSDVRDEAAHVATTARDEAADVAVAARDEAAEVVSAAKAQARDVVSTAKDEAASVVDLAREETAEVAHVAAAEARELVDTTRSELESQAETQLEQFAETLYRLAGQALALARGNPEQAGPLGELVGRAGHELRAVAAGIDEKGSAGLFSDAQRVVRQRPRAAIIGTAVAVVAGARLMGTPAGERVKEYIAPFKDQAIEAGRTMAEELKPIAQQRAEQVKAVATSAVDQVKQEAQGTVGDVKDTATQSARTVKGTARKSTTTVKGTVRQSSAAVKGTAKRTARATAPVG